MGIVNNELLDKWAKLAFNDLKASKSLLKEDNLLLAAFHLQQSLEKYLKMYYLLAKQDQPPFIYNLFQIATEANIIDQFNEDQKDLLNSLNPFYIKARYPTYKKELADSIDQQKTEDLLQRSEEVIEWLKQKMKQLGWQSN